jgi:uncharacterized membrane protein affecting hemolysin expression
MLVGFKYVEARVRSLTVQIVIGAEEFQRIYAGVNGVTAIADDGRRIRFPANILRPFVLHDGIRGHFRITFDADNKFSSIERIAEI